MTWSIVHTANLLDIVVVAGSACLTWRFLARSRGRALQPGMRRVAVTLVPALVLLAGARLLAMLAPDPAAQMNGMLAHLAGVLTPLALVLAGAGLVGALDLAARAGAATDRGPGAWPFALRPLVDCFADGVCITDRAGHCLAVNDALAALSGYARAELEGKAAQDLLPPDARFVPPRLGGGNAAWVEYRLRRKDGNLLDAEFAARTLVLGDTRLAIGVVRDISRRKRAEQGLAESRRWLQLALETGGVGTFDWDVDSGTAECSASYFALVGLPADFGPMTRAEFYARLHPDDRARVRDELRSMLSQRRRLETEFRVVWPDGSVHWLFGRAQAVAGPDGARTQRVVGAQTDITERKVAEQQLARSEALFRALVEQAPDGVTLTTGEGATVMTNPAIAAMTGYTTAELGTMNVADLLPAGEALALHPAAMAGQRVRRELRVQRKDGSAFEAEIIASPREIEGERLVLSVIRDISEQRALAASLRMRSDALEHSLNGVDIVDETGHFIYANEAYLRMWGFDSLDEIVGASPVSHCADPDDPPRIIAALREHGQDIRQFTARRRDGSTFEVLMASRRQVDRDGRELYVSTSLDVTERARAEQELRARETLISEAFEHLPFEFWICDLEGRYVLQNALCRERWGNMLGKPFDERYIPAAACEAWRSRDRQVRSGQPVTREFSYLHDGERVDYLEASVPLHDAGGEVNTTLGVAIDMTERTLARESLRASELRFRDFTEVAADWFWEQGPDLRMTYISGRVEEALNITVSELLGRSRAEYHTGRAQTDSPAWREHLAALEARKPFHAFEFDWLDDTGNQRVLSISGKPVFSEKGEFCGYRGVGSDVTHEREMQAALRASEARLQAAFHHLPFEFWMMDANGRYVMQNPACRERWGDWLGLTTAELDVPPMVREQWLQHDAWAPLGKPVQDEMHYEVDGETYDYLETLIPICDDTGKLTSVLGVGVDITESKRAQEWLRQSEQRFRDFAEIAADWFWELDAALRFSYVSPRFEAVTGRSASEYLGRSRREAHATLEPREAWERHFADLEAHRPYTFEFEFEGRDGRVLVEQNIGRPMFGANGEFLGYRGVGRDITERRRVELAQQRLLEENRALAQELLQTVEAERKRLAQELHDELGQALTAIQIEADNVVSFSAPEAEDARSSATAIRDAAARVYDTAHGMMERLHPAILEDLGLAAALEDLAGNWRLRHRSVDLVLRLQGDLDDLDEDIRITAYRIVQEALTNVTKHAGAGRVDVDLQRDGDRLDVRVDDDGVGADLGAPLRPRAMGLPGMRERALAIGGTLELRSAPGAGLTVRARLPTSPAVPAATTRAGG